LRAFACFYVKSGPGATAVVTAATAVAAVAAFVASYFGVGGYFSDEHGRATEV